MWDKNVTPYREHEKFKRADSNKEVVNPYDHDTRLMQDLKQRGYNPAFVQTLNLSVANEILIERFGYHFVIYGHDGSTNKAVNTTAFVNVWINQMTRQLDTPFPAKHARGFSGPFSSLYLQWPAQASPAAVYADLIIFASPDKPWVDGEAPT